MHIKIHHNQKGMVSILVTMIMMLVISLIVLGFAQVTRHNQREALDRQLSSQAYYAAESGVNDAVAYLQSNLTNLPATNTDCNSFITTLASTGITPDLGTNSGASYTCLMVDPDPPTLTKTPLAVNTTTVWPLTSASGKPWKTFTFTWANKASDATAKNQACPGIGKFPTSSAWKCSYGLFRLDLVDTSTVSPGTVADPTKVATFFLSPVINGSATAIPYKAGATVATGRCTGSTCTTTIALPANSSSYYARLSMLYEDSDSISLTGVTNDNASGKFVGGQAVIDSTGKAQDEIRRIQVRVPLSGDAATATLPTNALQTTGAICKYFTILPGQSADYSADPSPACNYGT